MMKINVAEQLKEDVGSIRYVTLSEAAQSASNIQGKLQLLRTDRSILVSGNLETTVTEVCGRCLEEFHYRLPLEIEDEFFFSIDPITSVALTPQTEPGAFIIDVNNILDITEAVRQYELLAEPMKPVCREDCAGLCSQCGCNLNQSTCSCAPSRDDSPWEPLQKLLSNLKQSSNKEGG